MKTVLSLSVFICCFIPELLSQTANNTNANFKSSKSNFDVADESPASNGLKSSSLSSSRKKVQNNTWEYSLMEGGNFTIGTNFGNSDKKIDDHCQLTYGHPFALTSFAYLTLDEKTFKPENFLSNIESDVFQNGDTLITEIEIENSVKSTFSINSDENGGLLLQYSILNTDIIPHKIKPGLLLDAALGKWGDGFVEYQGQILKKVTRIDGQLNDNLVLREREASPAGIGFSIKNITGNVVNLTVGNWQNEYLGDTTTMDLYDVALHYSWDETILQPEETAGFSIEITLLPPDYNNELFIRCDMPNAMSIENNFLFPGSLYTNFEIINNGEPHSNLTLRINDNGNVFPWESEKAFSIASGESYFYSKALVRIPEIYDSIVVPVSFSLLKSGQVVDEMTRNVFIPGAPFSDEGLAVTIDSSFIKLQKLYLRFHCIKEATQQLVYNIGKNNIFFYENSSQIKDFQLEKDTTGGTNRADIVFVLDVTGSMTEEIAGVRDNIVEFADSLSYRGIDFQLGMVTFLDNIENIYAFTNDVQLFREQVNLQFAHGGDDRPENSLEALSIATQFNFRASSNRIVIWITDADYHINDSFTNLIISTVTDALIANGITVNCIGDPQFQTGFYDPVVLNTGGQFFDIKGKFRDILLDVSRLAESPNYLLSFYPSLPINENTLFKVEVHYSGLGGFDTLFINSEKKYEQDALNTSVSAYPNPVNENTMVVIKGGSDLTYKFEVFNVYGQVISSYSAKSQADNLNVKLSDILNAVQIESGKIYILRIMALSKTGEIMEARSIKLEKQ